VPRSRLSLNGWPLRETPSRDRRRFVLRSCIACA
jgi:hypothetical protein